MSFIQAGAASRMQCVNHGAPGNVHVWLLNCQVTVVCCAPGTVPWLLKCCHVTVHVVRQLGEFQQLPPSFRFPGLVTDVYTQLQVWTCFGKSRFPHVSDSYVHEFASQMEFKTLIVTIQQMVSCSFLSTHIHDYYSTEFLSCCDVANVLSPSSSLPPFSPLLCSVPFLPSVPLLPSPPSLLLPPSSICYVVWLRSMWTTGGGTQCMPMATRLLTMSLSGSGRQDWCTLVMCTFVTSPSH